MPMVDWHAMRPGSFERMDQEREERFESLAFIPKTCQSVGFGVSLGLKSQPMADYVLR